jgi:hypothetical protein
MKGLHTLIIFLSAIICGQKSFGQDSASRFSVVVSPALFAPVSVAVQGGIQYRVSNRFSLLTEVALPIFYPKSTDYEEIKYWRTGIEIKYRHAKLKPSKGYLSLQTNYLYRKLIDRDESIVHRKHGEFIYEGATIKSPVLSTAFKIGFEVPSGKHFFADAFIGMGARMIFNQYSSKIFRLTAIQPSKGSLDFLPEEGWRFDYTLTRFHLTAGLRLGIKL